MSVAVRATLSPLASILTFEITGDGAALFDDGLHMAQTLQQMGALDDKLHRDLLGWSDGFRGTGLALA